MDTSERIVEAYLRYLKGYATIPNVKCGGQQEMDLLAIHPKTCERLHVEISVSVSSGFKKLTDKPYDSERARQRGQSASQRRTIGFFREKKFSSLEVVNELKQHGFAKNKYKKIIVSWDWTPGAATQAEKFGIELWSIQDLIGEIWDAVSSTRKFFPDDTLRTIHFLALSMPERR